MYIVFRINLENVFMLCNRKCNIHLCKCEIFKGVYSSFNYLFSNSLNLELKKYLNLMWRIKMGVLENDNNIIIILL